MSERTSVTCHDFKERKDRDTENLACKMQCRCPIRIRGYADSFILRVITQCFSPSHVFQKNGFGGHGLLRRASPGDALHCLKLRVLEPFWLHGNTVLGIMVIKDAIKLDRTGKQISVSS